MEYKQIIIARNERLKKIRDNPKLLTAAKIYYKTHPIDFINDWMFTYDPRKKPSVLPFILFKRQEEYIAWLWARFESKEDGLVEKSRDMGLTWLSMAYAIWMWLFHDGIKIGFGSRKEDLVDRIGDPDCIFEKGRMILRYLPKEFLPKEFDINKHCPHMKILNPDNDSAIIGESGKEIGRGGRSSMYFKDESAFYEQPKRIDAALSQNSDVKIDISTPNGEGNPFHQKRVSGKIPVFTFHWRDDPRKDDNWYKEQCEKLDPIIVAQEIDIDYAASAENLLILSKWVQAAIGLNLPASGARYAGLDVADEGGDENVLIMRKGVVVDFVEGWKEGDTSETTGKAYNYCIQQSANYFAYDGVGVGAGAKAEIKRLIKKDGNKHKITVASFISIAPDIFINT
jgi:phage terminase large subunit